MGKSSARLDFVWLVRERLVRRLVSTRTISPLLFIPLFSCSALHQYFVDGLAGLMLFFTSHKASRKLRDVTKTAIEIIFSRHFIFHLFLLFVFTFFYFQRFSFQVISCHKLGTQSLEWLLHKYLTPN